MTQKLCRATSHVNLMLPHSLTLHPPKGLAGVMLGRCTTAQRAVQLSLLTYINTRGSNSALHILTNWMDLSHVLTLCNHQPHVVVV